MASPFLGEILLVPYNFAPRGYAFCNGQILSIAQNTALFALLGTTYGGNGVQTFALPDLRGRVPVSSGQGPGLQPYSLGEIGGFEAVTLLSTQMPAHNHSVGCLADDADQGSPQNHFPANAASYSATGGQTMNPAMIGVAGGNQPHENRPPYLVINYVIALQGIFPSRS